MVVTLALSLSNETAQAQGFSWPWETQERPKPVPREPVYRDPPRRAPAPIPSPAENSWGSTTQNASSVCLKLERRLVQESQGGNKARDRLPQIENDIREARRSLNKLERDLERGDCYEWFLFSKQLRNSRACRQAVNDIDESKRRIAELEGQRHDIEATGGRSYQDEIIRELARNNCGPTYQQEARRRDGAGSGLWQDEEGGGPISSGNGFRALPYATYRTVCVRLCDGYYFPISFSTLPNHFQRDADACQSKCAAPAQLYYYQNPGGSVDQMVAYDGSQQYTKLKTAFLYRKEFINGCSCKQAEYVPQTPMPADKKAETVKAKPTTTGSTAAQGASVGQALDPWRPQ